MIRIVAAVLIAVPTGLAAGQLPETSLEAGATYLSPDNAGSGVGGYVAGRVRLADAMYVFGDYGQASPDYHLPIRGRTDVDHSVGTAGFGFRMQVSPAADFALEGAWIRSQWDFPGGSAEENGGLAAFHVRTRLDSGIELSTRAGYTVDGPAGSTWLLGMGAHKGLGGGFGLTVGALTYGGEDIHARFGLRYDFR